MGLFDLIGNKRNVATTRSALDAARNPGADDGGAVTAMIVRLMAIGIDGRPPFDSARKVAAAALAKRGSVEEAVDEIVGSHLKLAAAAGFATSVGGFVTMPVAIPANVFAFYTLATRMVAATAVLRGYDVRQPEIRTAVLLTFVGSTANDLLAKAGVSTGGGRLASLALRRLPPSAVIMIQKGIGFRLLRGVGAKALSRFGKAVPVLGGAVGAAVDFGMMRTIAAAARTEFPLAAAAADAR